MKTLLISEIFPPRTGGSGRWFWEVYRRLARTNYIIAAGEESRQREFDKTHNLNIARIPLSLSAWGLRSWRGLSGYGKSLHFLSRLVRQHGVDRVHAGRVLPEGVMAWCLKQWFGVPYLCFVHGEEITCTSESRELLWLARRVVAGADFLIANSRNTVRIVQEVWGARPKRVRLLHPGVDTNRFYPSANNQTIRERLGWGKGPVILTVGRLQKRKGHDQMILALKEIRNRIPDVLYAIVGDGEEKKTLLELIAQEGLTNHVALLGERDDAELISCYQQCDLFVLPNRQVGQDIEGFGMVLLEAQACGKPVIAGASGGTSETMNIPKTGQVVDCSTPAALGSLVTQWLSDPPLLAKMGKAARAWVEEQFDWAVLAKKAEELFQEQNRHRLRAGVFCLV